jgi:hypothetical protein
VNHKGIQRKSNIDAGFRLFLLGADLKLEVDFLGSFPRLTFLGISSEFWQVSAVTFRDGFSGLFGQVQETIRQTRSAIDTKLQRSPGVAGKAKCL